MKDWPTNSIFVSLETGYFLVSLERGYFGEYKDTAISFARS